MHIMSDKFFSKMCLSSPLFIFSHNLLRVVKATRRFYVLNSVTLYLTSNWHEVALILFVATSVSCSPISIQWTLRRAGEYRSSVHLTRLAIGTLKRGAKPHRPHFPRQWSKNYSRETPRPELLSYGFSFLSCKQPIEPTRKRNILFHGFVFFANCFTDKVG